MLRVDTTLNGTLNASAPAALGGGEGDGEGGNGVGVGGSGSGTGDRAGGSGEGAEGGERSERAGSIVRAEVMLGYLASYENVRMYEGGGWRGE